MAAPKKLHCLLGLLFSACLGCGFYQTPKIPIDSPPDRFKEAVREKLRKFNSDKRLVEDKVLLDVAYLQRIPYGNFTRATIGLLSSRLVDEAVLRWELQNISYLVSPDLEVELSCGEQDAQKYEELLIDVVLFAEETGSRARREAQSAMEHLEIGKKWAREGREIKIVSAAFDYREFPWSKGSWYFIFRPEADSVEESCMVAVDATRFIILWTSPKN